ncbi:hypothetical protein AMATHDRAFT_58312 [Amanita thiersii Skay4041]|uniref:DUF676 domain-containing protein n=1 Tax=Amanita thiersii Skay4041 TaxID=703135 RepID=A0A2A9NR63_9AGAR|nr:hypothetical protein AMATHDRAFT_58312 [Amanita thiersii Skay4041]
MTSTHLLVLIHGMWGNPAHLAEAHRIVSEHHSEPKDDFQLDVLLAETNRDESTYDGIDWGGERVAEEILSKVKELERLGRPVKRLSITGYSLGGLIGRYVIGILYQQGFFDTVEPINFNTIATPHLGLPRYPSVLSRLMSRLGPKLLSRTGEQFYCVDRWSPRGRPLLEVMADPERAFYKGLSLFQHIRIYANAVNDITVPYVTAAIETQDPFSDHENNGITIKLDPTYEPRIEIYELPSSPPPGPPVLSTEWFQKYKLRKPLLPPFLQRQFPWNMLIYLSIPVIMPLFVSLTLIHFTLASRSSRARLKLLEEEENQGQKLIHILAELENEMQNESTPDLDNGPNINSSEQQYDSQPGILSPVQLRMAKSLNELPLKKEVAFITEVRNSHATIICRDIKRFPFHQRGEGILRHWAVSFIL